MQNVLIRKLENFGPLPEADKAFLNNLVGNPRHVGTRQDLVREGDSPGDVRLILEGFACRYKVLDDGRRQNMAYLIPGDFCDLYVFILKTMDHTIATLSKCTVVDIPRSCVLEMMDRPAIARALMWAMLVDEATLREWLVNIGARSAEKRIAHLLCELLMRLKAVGLTTDSTFQLPLTQQDIAETMGVSTMHVSRVIHRLRASQLITLNGKKLEILDVAKLKRFSGFNPNYLHLGDSAAPGGAPRFSDP